MMVFHFCLFLTSKKKSIFSAYLLFERHIMGMEIDGSEWEEEEKWTRHEKYKDEGKDNGEVISSKTFKY